MDSIFIIWIIILYLIKQGNTLNLKIIFLHLIILKKKKEKKRRWNSASNNEYGEERIVYFILYFWLIFLRFKETFDLRILDPHEKYNNEIESKIFYLFIF